jgi:hypothetical protein
MLSAKRRQSALHVAESRAFSSAVVVCRCVVAATVLMRSRETFMSIAPDIF